MSDLNSTAVARTPESQLREPGFKSCATVSNLGQVFLLHCMNEYLAIDSGECLYE